MNVSSQPSSQPGLFRKFVMSRVDVSTLDTQESASVEITDPDETQKLLAVKRTDRQEKSPATITPFSTQIVADHVKLPITPIPPSILDLPLSEEAQSGGIFIPIPHPEPIAPSGEYQEQIIDYQHKSGAVQRATKKKLINFAIRVGFTLLLFAFLFRSVSWSTVLMTLAQVNQAVVLMGLVVGAFGIVVSSYQWRSLLHSERIYFDLARLINLYMVGIAFSHFLPTGMGGDAIKAYYVGRDSNNNAGAASAVVMSRATGFFSMLFVASPALMIWHGHFTREVVIGLVSLSLLVGSLIGGAVFSVTLLPRLFKGTWAKHRIFASAKSIGNALSMTFRRPRFLCVAILFGILFHLVACLNYYTYATALGMNVPLYFYFVAIPLISLVAFLPISINGFGVRESAFVLVFSTIHVPSATSLLLALLMDVQVLFFGVVGGCIYFALAAGSKAKVTKQQRVV